MALAVTGSPLSAPGQDPSSTSALDIPDATVVTTVIHGKPTTKVCPIYDEFPEEGEDEDDDDEDDEEEEDEDDGCPPTIPRPKPSGSNSAPGSGPALTSSWPSEPTQTEPPTTTAPVESSPAEPTTASDGAENPSSPSSTGSYIYSTPSFPTPTNDPSSTRDILPVSSPHYMPVFNEPDFTPKEQTPTGPIERGTVKFKIESYPDTWKTPSGDHEEVQAAIAAINWDKVPKAPVRTADKGTGDLDMKSYDVGDDEYCWWSATGCVKPKAQYIPEDAHICNEPGDWGLTFDDGPLNPRKDVVANSPDGIDEFAEPYLYDFLAEQGTRATLFYVGSNVVTYPEAAKRAFDAGHHLCLHTWSHVAMTTLKDEEVVAELYWALRAVKEATGATSKCWRPPFGDVDDRVRAIAHQMGLTTVLWSRDSNDWNLPSMTNKGQLEPETVDGYFSQWIDERMAGNETHGHIGLQHELNEVTIGMAEKWLPKLKEAFSIKPIHECTAVGMPYWEMGSEGHHDSDEDHDHDHDHDEDDEDSDDDKDHKDKDDDHDDEDHDDDSDDHKNHKDKDDDHEKDHDKDEEYDEDED
ncbi:hypothetical protein BDB00DRAFT_756910 [Zychaea mexicana]|uniref:uncharacterized protein n=1 Tax=Zychaea mexicana TaxID=64656 RepID=UPI0022FED46B|nr:uncharacterized protein BDB00DRAFT_756910 [Zychaea mexicana]KAI9497133.1 hypothetical protein BDB00DRAFT_756910 [Zychaea mexicana]